MSLATNLVHVRATGAGAISESFTPAGEVLLYGAWLHLSAAGGAVEDYLIFIDSGTNALYDINLNTSAMNLLVNVAWIPDTPVAIAIGDVVDFTYTNTNARTWGLEYIYRKDF